MLGPHKIVIKTVGFFMRQGEDLLGARGEIVRRCIADKVWRFAPDGDASPEKAKDQPTCENDYTGADWNFFLV